MMLATRLRAILLYPFVMLVFAASVPLPARADAADIAQVKSGPDKGMEQVIVIGLIANESSAGTKTDVPILETPMSISVLTEERMEELGVQTVQDALLYTAGVHAGAYGTDTRGDWSTIRGSEPVQYVDGLKSLFGFYNNTRPNPFALGQVEILKGPSSVLYGQGSTGGIVNLVSKRPQEEKQGEIWTQYGSFDRKQVAADFTGPVGGSDQLFYRLVGLYRNSDMQTDHVSDDSVVVSPALTWHPGDDTTLTLLGNYQNSDSGTGTPFLPWAGTIFPGPNGRIDTDTFISEPDWDRYDTEQAAVTVLLDHAFNETWSFHTAARYSDSSADYYSMWPAFPPTIQPDGHNVTRTAYVSLADASAWTVDARVQAEFATGSIEHTLLAGFDYQDVTTDNDYFYDYTGGGDIDIYHPVYGNIPAATPITYVPADVTTQQGFYFQDHMKIADHWIVSLALRHDDADSHTRGSGTEQEDREVTGRAGLMYLFDNGVAPYFSYAQSFNPVIGTDLSGNSFKPLKGEQFEAGFKYQPPGSIGMFTAAVYDITEQNRQTSDPANPFNSLQTGAVGIQGIELEAQMAWNDLSVLAGYSYTDAKIEDSNDGDEGNHVANIADHLFSTWVTWRPSGSWRGFRAGAGVRHVGASWDGADIIETPAYTLVDAMVGFDYGNWGVSIDADNLADNVHVASCLARGDCFYGARRSVTANVRFSY